MTSTSSTDTVCFSIKFVLGIFGVWPNVSRVYLPRLFWSTSLIVTQIFQYRYFVVHFGTDDLPDLMDNLSCCLAYTLLFFKLIIFWINRRKFCDVLTMIAADWKECTNDSFSIHIMESAATLSHRVSNAIIGLHMTAVITYSFGVFLAGTKDDSFNVSTVPARELILKMELPFDSYSSPFYELVMIVQFFQLLSNACAIDVLNALLLTLIFHVGGQIDILQEWLRNLIPDKNFHCMSVMTMKNLIGKHQKIIIFSENINRLYSYIALMQFVSNTLIICCIGFVIVTSMRGPDACGIVIKTLMFYIVMNLEAFIFCYAGEYLSTKSQRIADTAYGSLWYDMRMSDRQTISFLILRSQKRLTITAGKIMDLSLECFANIVKTSASYVSVLLAMS